MENPIVTLSGPSELPCVSREDSGAPRPMVRDGRSAADASADPFTRAGRTDEHSRSAFSSDHLLR